MRDWLIHAPSAACVLVWVIAVCEIPLWQYALLYVWPGVSLTLLRSYLEHQGRAEVGHRTAIIEAGPLTSLMYLNNNLHALHHLEPAEVWHQRPRHYRERQCEILAGNGGYRYGGYGEIIWRYLFRPKEPLLHPLGDL
jgi:fatty acid desaturase